MSFVRGIRYYKIKIIFSGVIWGYNIGSAADKLKPTILWIQQIYGNYLEHFYVNKIKFSCSLAWKLQCHFWGILAITRFINLFHFGRSHEHLFQLLGSLLKMSIRMYYVNWVLLVNIVTTAPPQMFSSPLQKILLDHSTLLAANTRSQLMERLRHTEQRVLVRVMRNQNWT